MMEYPKPEIGSLWQAKDDRQMFVSKINPGLVDGGWWAEMYVLPPYAKRQRRRSEMNAVFFFNGFLAPVVCQEIDPSPTE